MRLPLALALVAMLTACSRLQSAERSTECTYSVFPPIPDSAKLQPYRVVVEIRAHVPCDSLPPSMRKPGVKP